MYELKQLKSDFAALDRKITATLDPKREKQDFGKDVEQPQSPNVEVADNPAQTGTSKKSMVAEPADIYKPREMVASGMAAASYGYAHSDGFRCCPKI